MFSTSLPSPGLSVSVERRSGRPCAFRVDGQRLAVTSMEGVRDETAAYSVETGPRTVFVVRSGQRRYRLVHLLRERRWTIEELPLRAVGLTRVA
jgi:hypothetical protein